jgi:hypothetical protein
MSDHWLVRLNGDSKRGSLVSRSSTTCPSSVPDSPESPVFLDDPPREEEGEGPGKHEMHGKPKKGKNNNNIGLHSIGGGRVMGGGGEFSRYYSRGEWGNVSPSREI